jgi:uncharacterized protein YjiS (DUF1127 family)
LAALLRDGLALLIDCVLEWHDRRRQRYALQMLDDRLLKDIGISRADIQGEADKPFWKP